MAFYKANNKQNYLFTEVVYVCGSENEKNWKFVNDSIGM